MPRWMTTLLRSPEDGTGSGSFFQGSAPAGASSSGEQGGTPAGGQPAGATPPAAGERPAWLPEKFATPEDLGKAYGELYGKFSTKTDLLKEQLRGEVQEAWKAERGAPEKPEAYAYPEGFQAPGEAVDKSLRDWAHANGVSQDAFQSLVKDVHGQTVASHAAEMGKLGENAQTRIDTLNTWIKANVDPAHYPALEKLLVTADAVALFEHLRDGKRSAGFMPEEQGAPAAPELTRASIRELQASREYQSGDPATVEKVQAMWAKFSKLPSDKRK